MSKPTKAMREKARWVVAELVEDYERRAAAFYEETGLMAPGKDDITGHHTYEERFEAWRAWTQRQAREDA